VETQETKHESPAGCLLRVFWMVLGNIALFFMAYFIAVPPSGSRQTLSVFDAVYAATVGALILSRYLDIRYCSGATASGGPATMANFRRYVLILVIASLAIWGGAHAISYFR